MAVVASYTTDVSEGSIPLVVNFTDTSTGLPTAWIWDFGDGYTSVAQHPTHTYNSIGSFTVTLKAFDTPVTSETAATFVSARLRSSEPESSSNATEHAQLLAEAFASSVIEVPRFQLDKDATDTDMAYTQNEGTFNFDLTGDSGVFAGVLFAFDLTAPNVPESGVKNDNGWKLDALTSPASTFYLVEDVTTLLGTSINRIFSDLGAISGFDLTTPASLLATPASDATPTGWRMGDPPKVIVYTSAASNSSVSNNILATAALITRPTRLFSGFKEASLSDGWEENKHFYIVHDKPYPCVIQAVDLYLDATNE